MVQVTPPIMSFTLQPPHAQPNLQGLLHGQLTPQIQTGIAPAAGTIMVASLPNQTIQMNPMIGLATGVQIPHGQFPPIPHVPPLPVVPPVPPTPPRPFTSPIPGPVFQPHPPLSGQGQSPQVPPTEFPPQGAVPPPSLAGQVEVINGQAANSSLEQLGCGFDWLTNTCKDVFVIGWCGQCHDFGNIFMHDCKCVRPLISLPPRQPVHPTLYFNMI
ncbi:hypothetical protein KIN20_016261 [Parelaphostrongylus tenuis]|uniref:Uncharacterized protein n=1 Tax=Parelaphostrongylus tenuis TaxID=148309 RepID=A0AAD5MG66_PARTN|nr:hypothetical protein KIN20_016261 [Parelaphostrongylus tenuis]